MLTDATQFEQDVLQLFAKYAAQEKQIRASTPCIILQGAPEGKSLSPKITPPNQQAEVPHTPIRNLS